MSKHVSPPAADPEDALVSGYYRSLPQAEPGPSLDARIRAAVAAELGAPVIMAAPLEDTPRNATVIAMPPRRRWLPQMALAASLVIGVGLGYRWLEHARHEAPPGMDEAPALAPATTPMGNTSVPAEVARSRDAPIADAAMPSPLPPPPLSGERMPQKNDAVVDKDYKGRDARPPHGEEVGGDRLTPPPGPPPRSAQGAMPPERPPGAMQANVPPPPPKAEPFSTEADRSAGLVQETGPNAFPDRAKKAAPLAADVRREMVDAPVAAKPTDSRLREQMEAPKAAPAPLATAEPERAAMAPRRRELSMQAGAEARSSGYVEPVPTTEAAPAARDAAQSSPAMLKEVRDLIKSGRTEQARRVLLRWHARYPDERVPHDLEALLKSALHAEGAPAR